MERTEDWSLYAACKAFAKEYDAPNPIDELQEDKKFPTMTGSTFIFCQLFYDVGMGADKYSRQDLIHELLNFLRGYAQNDSVKIRKLVKFKTRFSKKIREKVNQIEDAHEKGKKARELEVLVANQ